MWKRVVDKHGERLLGDRGDPLTIDVTAVFVPTGSDEPPDFADHEWICEIRKRAGGPLVAAPTFVSADVTVGATSTAVALRFHLADTTLLPAAQRRHLMGIAAVSGANSPCVVVSSYPIEHRIPVVEQV